MIRFLKLNDSHAKDWPKSLRLSLANVYENNKDFSNALAIYEEVSIGDFEAPRNRLRARIAFQAGKIEEARDHQSTYQSMVPVPSHEELVFMGDLHRVTGRKAEAADAYSAAVAQIQQMIKRDASAIYPEGRQTSSAL